MKSFLDLLKERKFLYYFIVLAVLIIWNLFFGFRLLAIIFLAVLLVALGLNLYKTQNIKKT